MADRQFQYRCNRANHGKIVAESELEKTKNGRYRNPKCDFCNGRMKLIKIIVIKGKQ